ncbi:hypothetical protein EHI8A_116040 [Entamoeba histolytica HM-1:IMSS-B]|uniref:TLDc domain-containing protein n=5 Tax=Entamoeba histolytica TaxID=5759 RepID=C4M138_ENTH1|nr:hypothetical protein EHI_105340 [Entamoeba histolytica HM-1:IMSS]EMD42463.1 Hypothetical protein EHI5A_068310 [Entamoeba histolytica KU27]EMH72254.1 hypothetical protein EHI8A_116040 [Entamoeba histolytica HM-1:IMSS-B]ENY64359.1 hypothetical protein EHI7A_080280 [Entamoeba histolytica HM-1:IMSS-A]GAT94911.1 hypothetical protein CL6EHI_105340 [Entamoeba histolytica]EAL48558.1 hypothetical protein EHI_105340 [Entamoeba histolytica HM-1:IMSS]|eukprot:XP_653945.1 hypothetical protein EHI_105340 [Entamoeba histolytica HM-1:IMSS]
MILSEEFKLLEEDIQKITEPYVCDVLKRIVNVMKSINEKKILEMFGINNEYDAMNFVFTHEVNEEIKNNIFKQFGVDVVVYNQLVNIKNELMVNPEEMVEQLNVMDNQLFKFILKQYEFDELGKGIILLDDAGLLEDEKHSIVKKYGRESQMTLRIDKIEEIVSKMKYNDTIKKEQIPEIQQKDDTKKVEDLKKQEHEVKKKEYEEVINKKEIEKKDTKNNYRIKQMDVLKKHIPIMKNEIGMKHSLIIFDSITDGYDGSTLFKRVYNQNNIYIVIFDSQQHGFGAFVKSGINKINEWNYVSEHYLFTIEDSFMKYNPRKGVKTGIVINEGSQCLLCIGAPGYGLVIYKPPFAKSYCYNTSMLYHAEDLYFNQSSEENGFLIKRLIVVKVMN